MRRMTDFPTFKRLVVMLSSSFGACYIISDSTVDYTHIYILNRYRYRYVHVDIIYT